MKSRKAASRKAPAKKKASRATATANKKSPQKSAARSRIAEKPKKLAVKAKTKSKVVKAVTSKDRLKDKKLKPKAEEKKKVSAKVDKARDKAKTKVSAKPVADAKAKLKTRVKEQGSDKAKAKLKPVSEPKPKRADKVETKKTLSKKVEAKPKSSAPPEKIEKIKVKAKAEPELSAKPKAPQKGALKSAPKAAEKPLEKEKAKVPAPSAKPAPKGKVEAEPKAKSSAEAKSAAPLKGKAAPPPPAPSKSKPSAPAKPEPSEREKEKARIEPKSAAIAKEKEKAKPAPVEPKEAPRTKLKPAVETRAATTSKGSVSIKDGNVRILFPRWFRGPLEGLIASYLSSEYTDNGPHALAVTLGQAFADLVSDRLGAETLDRVAALLGSPSSENSQFIKRLSRALERGFEEREDGALLEEVDEGWLVKTFLNALGISFSPRKYVAMRLLTRPLFEKAIADVLMEVRGSTLTPRGAALRIVDAVNAVAKRCGLGEMEQRIAELRQREPRLEVVLASRLDGLRLGSAPPSQWRELGFPDVAARGKDERENVGSSSPIWIARERDASMVLDRLADIADLSWSADGAGGEVQNDEARLAEAGLVKTYRLDGVFAKGDTLRHSTFGLGVVTVCTRETIEVAFPGGMKKLAHGRTLP